MHLQHVMCLGVMCMVKCTLCLRVLQFPRFVWWQLRQRGLTGSVCSVWVVFSHSLKHPDTRAIADLLDGCHVSAFVIICWLRSFDTQRPETTSPPEVLPPWQWNWGWQPQSLLPSTCGLQGAKVSDINHEARFSPIPVDPSNWPPKNFHCSTHLQLPGHFWKASRPRMISLPSLRWTQWRWQRSAMPSA